MSSSILFPTNEYAISSKSSEEIQKLSMPLFVRIEDAINYIIAKGLPAQFTFLYRNLAKAPRLALPTVCTKAPSEDSQNQIAIAVSLRQLLEQQGDQLTAPELQMIFETCLECLNNLQSPSNEEMGRVLEATIRCHPQHRKLLRRLQEVGLDLGRPSQPIISKVTAGRLVSILAGYLGRTVKGELIDVLKRVLGDSEVQARKVWVSQIFPRLLKNLELQFIELHLQQKIYQAVWDQNEEIAVLALEVILKNAARFSLEQQSTRIAKLFIDSLTAKRQKISILASQLLGQAYQRLLPSILRNQQLCIRFWRSLIELSQSKNERVLNNLAYNLPGVLVLSVPVLKVEPMCDVYIELFYHPQSDKYLLASYFHQIANMFPGRASELRQLVYWMLSELFQQDQPCEEAVRIVSRILQKLSACRAVFMEGEGTQKCFDSQFCQYLMQFYTVLQNRKHCNWLTNIHLAIKDSFDSFGAQWTESSLLPRLYASLRSKPAGLEPLVEAIVRLVTRQSNSSLINAYTSKISVELSKSSKSYERETALLFYYYSTFYCSIELFQEYRLGEKFLGFNSDKNFKVKTTFIKYLPRMVYFFTRQQKIEHAIILSRLGKDPDIEIQLIMEGINFIEDDIIKKNILEQSKVLKEKEKERAAVLNIRKHNQNRRSSKEIKKEDVLKKRIETTKSKTKMLIKEMPKKKVAPVLVKTVSNLNFRKHS